MNGPTIETIATSISGLVTLYLVKLLLEMRDTLYGDKKNPIGLVAAITTVGEQFNNHCNDIVNRATVVVSESETRLGARIDGLSERVDGVSKRVDLLADRRKHNDGR